MQIPQIQYDVLQELARAAQPVELLELAARLGLDQSPVSAASAALAEQGLVAITEQPYQELRLGPAGLAVAAGEFPERAIIRALAAAGGACAVSDLPRRCGLSSADVGQSLRWLAQRGWAKKEGEALVLLADGQAAAAAGAAGGPRTEPDEQVLAALADGRAASADELTAQGVPVAAALALLSSRRNFLIIKERRVRTVALAPPGQALLAAGVAGRRTVTQLTPDLLAEGGWRSVDLQPYDVTLAAKKLYPGKEHAFQRTLDRVRRVFLELGFTEIASPWVESSFWDFDALFQPQDHPARDMQDTFYVSRPARCRLPDPELVQRVRATHETGGETGSTGWQYRWDPERAHQPVLRTHTTAATIRALAAHAAAARSGACAARSGRYFVIGPVFRRETVDYKHLPVFHQVDGIIVDPDASLATLLGTLGAFYGKMGFPRVRFRPSFFPYTEPSAEVYLWLESRREWVEMGGSGIFRPEVTQPLGIRERVLAWGLGLERLAMMIHDLKSIGELYYATMPWLRESPVRRS